MMRNGSGNREGQKQSRAAHVHDKKCTLPCSNYSDTYTQAELFLERGFLLLVGFDLTSSILTPANASAAILHRVGGKQEKRRRALFAPSLMKLSLLP
jgi:hypothetical protein